MLLSAFLGLSAGTLIGLLGAGGSIIAVPILLYIMGMDTKTAIGTSLLIVGLSSLLATVSHYRQHHVLVGTAVLFGAAGAVGSYFGAEIARYIADGVQIVMFAVVMLLIGIAMLTKKERVVRQTNDKDSSRYFRLAVTILVGIGAGLLTGLLGVGGGFIVVPAMSSILKLTVKDAIGTSLLVIAINSIVGAYVYASYVRLSPAIVPFAAGTLLAAPIAGHFAHHIEPRKLRTAFALALLILSSLMITTRIVGN